MAVVHVDGDAVVVDGFVCPADARIGELVPRPVGRIDFVDVGHAQAALAVVGRGFGRRRIDDRVRCRVGEDAPSASAKRTANSPQEPVGNAVRTVRRARPPRKSDAGTKVMLVSVGSTTTRRAFSCSERCPSKSALVL